MKGSAPGQRVGEYTFHPRLRQGPVYVAVLYEAARATDTQVFASLKTGTDLTLLLLPMLTREINIPVLGLTPVSCFLVG